VTPAICPEAPYPRVVPESGILDTVPEYAEEEKIVAEYKEEKNKEVKKAKEPSSSSSSEEVSSEDLAPRRVRRYVFPAAIPRLRYEGADRERSVASAAASRHG
ncbi:hypothetical protein PMAYCL1PPCAC_08714, partial [Pristionchus mayeri]